MRSTLLFIVLLGGCSTTGLDLPPYVDSGADATLQPGADLSTISQGTLSIIVEPSDRGAALLAAIRGATQSIHMTMYLLTNRTIARALVSQKAAGLDVKVVLNQSFPDSSSSNAEVFSMLQAGNVDVVWAPSTFTYTHEKALVLDGSTAWIMTMNATETSSTKNREYLAVDTQPADIAEVEAIFEADYANTPWTQAGPLVVSPVNSRNRIVALIDSAQRSIDLEVEELSDDEVVAALNAKQDAGLALHVVLSNESPSSTQANALASLKLHSVPVVSVAVPYIHAKAIVVDGATCFVGSENFSTGSLEDNREVGLIFTVVSELQKVDATILADYTAGTPE